VKKQSKTIKALCTEWERKRKSSETFPPSEEAVGQYQNTGYT